MAEPKQNKYKFWSYRSQDIGVTRYACIGEYFKGDLPEDEDDSNYYVCDDMVSLCFKGKLFELNGDEPLNQTTISLDQVIGLLKEPARAQELTKDFGTTDKEAFVFEYEQNNYSDTIFAIQIIPMNK